MSDHVHVRAFRRADRDQLTALASAHVAAVLPGASLSVDAVMSQGASSGSEVTQ